MSGAEHTTRPAHTALIAGAIACAMALMLALTPLRAQAESPAGDMPQMVQVVPSSKSFAQTLAAFRAEVAAAGWSILNENNMAGVLSARGYTLDPVMIFDVCSGKYSAQILGDDVARPMSAFMPCRVSIYQTSDGKVYITRMNTEAFAQMLDPMVAEVMLQSDAEISAIIDAAVK